MLTTHPSIMLGSYVWDEDRLPRDEFDLRVAELRAAMQRNDWRAMLIYGDAREHSALAFFTNFIPRMRWAMAVLPREGEPRLLASMSSRDMPAMRTMTWIPDVRSGWEWRWFEESAAQLAPGGAIGTMGFGLMTPLLFAQVEKTLAGAQSLESADRLVEEARRRHRPREIALMRRAADVVRAAAEAIEDAWRKGQDIESAALEGERTARRLEAQDVRTLVSYDGGRTLEPYRGAFDLRPDRLLAYVAVKSAGYWAELFVGSRGEALVERANAMLDALLSRLSLDAPVAELTRRAGLPTAAHPFLGEGIGHRIGLSPVEGEALQAGARLQPETVYALRAATLDAAGRSAVASAMVVLRGDGGQEILARSVGS